MIEIRVNKTARERKVRDFLNNTIIMAQDVADRGRDKFRMRYPRNIGCSPHELMAMVEKETNNTVYGGYKCITDGFITFNIRS
ncbi:MAG: hypothetical protein CMP95_05090 [Gammaproteobacteria bacterium]|nr:hypothetical protein [Gammaproteobacteria bacterium]|tara:strand:+ start:1964 stop:2212 length:249 start_codon:yes stop_codon:yes gene_type:complete